MQNIPRTTTLDPVTISSKQTSSTVKHLQGLIYSEAMECLQQFSVKKLRELAVDLNLPLGDHLDKANLKHIVYINSLLMLGVPYVEPGQCVVGLNKTELVLYLIELPEDCLYKIADKMQLNPINCTKKSVINSIVYNYTKCSCGSRLTNCVCS